MPISEREIQIAGNGRIKEMELGARMAVKSQGSEAQQIEPVL
jgi:hypothetical protein